MPAGEEGPYFDFFETWICELLELAIDEADGAKVFVGFESPFLASGRFDKAAGRFVPAATSIKTLRKLYGLASFTELVCWRFNRDYGPGVECREMQNGTIKKELTGDGRAGKPDMVNAAVAMGVVPESEDEADAFGGWLVMMRHYGAENWPLWEGELCRVRGLIRPGAKAQDARKKSRGPSSLMRSRQPRP